MSITSFKELTVWQRAVELARETHRASASLPPQETYGLQSQMRRAAVSIASNIAEGKRRGTGKDFLQFLRIADGSCAELETQILIAQSLYSNCNFTRSKALLEETQKMLAVLMKKIRSH